MNSAIVRTVSACVCLVLLGALDVRADEAGEAVRRAVSKVTKSTLRIRTVGNSSEQGGLSSQVTTGICLSKDGYVLSSTFGFPSTAAAVFVEDSDGQRVAAKLVARDTLRQLVLLKCEDGRFVVPRFSSDRWPEVGAYAIAAGRLYSAPSPTLSVGIVSAVNRVYGMALQTDAKISPVNYGGPLVNLQGEIMGILVPLSPRATGDGLAAGVEWYDSGIGFAIPSSDMIEAAKRLRDGQDRSRGVMGISLTTRNPLSPIVQIGRVLPGSPADQAGIKKADVVVSANDVDVDRVGIFDSVVKSSYAGDQLKLKVKDDQGVREVSLKFTDRLVRPPTGYLGLVLRDESAALPGADIQIEALVLPSSPAAEVFDRTSIRITGLNGKPTKSLKKLTSDLSQIVPGQEVSLSVLAPKTEKGDKADDVTVKLTASNRPEKPLEPESDFLKAAQLDGHQKNWKQFEEKFDDAGKAWIYGPDFDSKANVGLLVLLSKSTASNDRLLSEWVDICQERGLILLVPRNSEKTELTSEDRGLILKSVQFVSKKYALTSRRQIIVTEKLQAPLATDLLLNARQPVAGGAAFLQTWPQTSAAPADLLAAAAMKVLLIEGTTISRQQQALFRQSVRDLKESNAWLTVQPPSESARESTQELIADWYLQQLAF